MQTGKWEFEQMTERAQGCRSRLFVAVDFRSIDAEAFEVEYIERAVFSEVSARFGSEWDEMNLRAYPGVNREELLGRIRWLSREKKIRRWRAPRRRGRLPPSSWHKAICSDAYLWCIRDRGARKARTLFVLVANDGDFSNIVREMEEASVETFVCSWKDSSKELVQIFGRDRVCTIKPEGLGTYDW